VTELQQNRYDQLLRRVGDLKGPGSKVNDVLQELFPTLDVENVPGELLLLMATRIGWAGASKAPTAGKAAGIQLFNPAGSGHLVTVSTVWLAPSSTATYNWGTTTLPLATNTGLPKLRDTRNEGATRGVTELRTSPDAIALTSGIVRILGATTVSLNDENSFCVLAPGTGLTFVGSVDATIRATFAYRERVAEPSELSF